LAGLFVLRLLATVPEEPEPEELLQIVASSGFRFILTRERKTAPINSAATVQDVEGVKPTRSPAKHTLSSSHLREAGRSITVAIPKKTLVPPYILPHGFLFLRNG
jgi:hypothetical protein